jgi:hypothetical protein
MRRLLRITTRVFGLIVALTTLFGMGSAAVAAVTKRRIETTKDPASNEPTAASVFAGERFESRAPALRGGRVITWFAGHDVDLRGATIDPSGATLDLRTMYGGTQVAIPEGWRVESHVRSLFGGTQVDIHDADLPADAPLLELRGFSLFGGVRVTTSPDASWSGQDHDGEALPPAESVASTPIVDLPTTDIDDSAAAVDSETAVGPGAPAASETAVGPGAPAADAPLPA